MQKYENGFLCDNMRMFSEDASILFHVRRMGSRICACTKYQIVFRQKSSGKKYRNADYPSLNEPLLPPAVCGSAGLGWNRLVIR